jgi:hypothetical protein
VLIFDNVLLPLLTLGNQFTNNMAQSQAQLQGLTAQLQALAVQMSALAIPNPLATFTNTEPPAASGGHY